MPDLTNHRFRFVGAGVAVGVVLLGSLLIPAGAQDRTVSGVAGCDTSRTGVTYASYSTHSQPAPGVVPCLTYNFPQYGEGGIVVTPPVRMANGAVAPSAVMQSGAFTPSNSVNPSYGLGRSVDGGAHWEYVRFPGDVTETGGTSGGSDPGLIRDPYTHRVFEWSDGTNTANVNISFSDDNGETWVNNPGPPYQFFPTWDAIIMFTGRPHSAADRKALRDASYPDVVYLCGGGACFKSLDGGVIFSEIKDSAGTDEAGANGAVIAGPTGILYGVVSGGKTLSVSDDDGVTWTTKGQGAFSISRDCVRAGQSAPLVVDKSGNLYMGGSYTDQAGKTRLAAIYSTDGGASWSKPIPLQMPEVAGVSNGNGGSTGTLCAFAADWDRPGHVAMSYLGYTAGNAAGAQHGYLSDTSDIFAATPTFTGVQADSDAHPLFPNGPPCSFPPLNGACVPHGMSRMDYLTVTISPIDGQPWALFFKDVCRIPACYNQASPTDPMGAVDRASGGYRLSSWQGAVATIASTKSGR